MGRSAAKQTLSYPLRLPDVVQADALRLLDVSREVINATVVALWPRLDEFGVRQTRYAYKQVTALIGPSDPHGDRQYRCEAEQAGRILRGQARRKQQFARILPLLSAGMIEPKRDQKRAGKSRIAIKAALAELREEDSDGGSAVELQSLVEQCCNFYLKQGRFPDCYEEIQAIPVLGAGVLPYAADDGSEKGQAYHLRLDVQGRCVSFAFRFPDETGTWRRTWAEPEILLTLPDAVVERLRAGAALAPTLREIRQPDGTRYAVLDFIVEVEVAVPVGWAEVGRVLGWDWGVRTLVTATVLDLQGNRLAPPLFLNSGGFDGRQARTRRQIDRLRSKVATLEAQRDSQGRGRGAKGRWVNWRNNAQIRGALWRCLRYKCHLEGTRLVWQHPKGTTHTCPQCGKPAHTYASPALNCRPLVSGAWLRCLACGWNGARDYAAAINIALLGGAFLKQDLQTGQAHHPLMTEKPLNSESYSGSGLALRLPPTTSRGCLIESGRMYVNGWIKSVALHSALPRATILRLCG